MMTLAERRTHWRTIIEDQATSGLNITAYCREKQIKRHQFHSWQRRLREQQSGAGGFLELIPGKASKAGSKIRIHPGTELIIEVERGFDPLTLRAVIETLRGLSRCSA